MGTTYRVPRKLKKKLKSPYRNHKTLRVKCQSQLGGLPGKYRFVIDRDWSQYQLI